MDRKIVVVGAYDVPLKLLFAVDLMRMLGLAGTVQGVVYRTQAFEKGVPPVDRVTSVSGGRFVIRSNNFNAASTVDCIRSIKPDLLVYAGGTDILKKPLLNSARLGCIGGHYGSLPKIRGMASVEWSILLGVHPTVAIQKIGEGIDTGEVIMQSRVHLRKDDTFTDIRERSYSMTKAMLALSAKSLFEGQVFPKIQDAGAGRQYFRMHPFIREYAEKRLRIALSDLDRGASCLGVAGC